MWILNSFCGKIFFCYELIFLCRAIRFLYLPELVLLATCTLKEFAHFIKVFKFIARVFILFVPFLISPLPRFSKCVINCISLKWKLAVVYTSETTTTSYSEVTGHFHHPRIFLMPPFHCPRSGGLLVYCMPLEICLHFLVQYFI